MMGMNDYCLETLSKVIYTGASNKTLENATIAATTFYNKRIKSINPQTGIKAGSQRCFTKKIGNLT